MIAVTGHHAAMCCPFCETELTVDVCLNVGCFLFGHIAPIPVQRLLPDRPPRVAEAPAGAPSMFFDRRRRHTEASEMWAEAAEIRNDLRNNLR